MHIRMHIRQMHIRKLRRRHRCFSETKVVLPDPLPSYPSSRSQLLLGLRGCIQPDLGHGRT